MHEGGEADFSHMSHNHKTAKRVVIRQKMKAQLVFEFMIAVVIFFGVVMYVLSYLNGSVAGYSSDFAYEAVQSKATQIAELLVMNKGNWTGAEPSVEPVIPGLAEEWPTLNYSKIIWLNTSCNSDYHRALDSFGIPYKNNVKITITDEAGAALADCPWGKDAPTNVTKAESKRYALNETGSVLAVYVGIWASGKYI